MILIRKKTIPSPNRNQTYTLPDIDRNALPLSCGRPAVKGHGFDSLWGLGIFFFQVGS